MSIVWWTNFKTKIVLSTRGHQTYRGHAVCASCYYLAAVIITHQAASPRFTLHSLSHLHSLSMYLLFHPQSFASALSPSSSHLITPCTLSFRVSSSPLSFSLLPVVQVYLLCLSRCFPLRSLSFFICLSRPHLCPLSRLWFHSSCPLWPPGEGYRHREEGWRKQEGVKMTSPRPEISPPVSAFLQMLVDTSLHLSSWHIPVILSHSCAMRNLKGRWQVSVSVTVRAVTRVCGGRKGVRFFTKRKSHKSSALKLSELRLGQT